MSQGALAKRYSRAFFNVLEDNGKNIETVSLELKTANECLDQVKSAKNFFSSPKIPANQKEMIIETLSSFCHLSREVNDFIRFLLKKNRLNLLGDIADSFETLFHDSQSLKKALIKSVLPLNEEQIQLLKNNLEKQYQKTFIFDFIKDESLIGGFTVQIDDHVIDASIKNELNKMKKQILDQVGRTSWK